MKYEPFSATWEITAGCNLRCKHCGSSCEDALKEELTTEEALKLCDDLGRLGVNRITLSGGEPFTRNDWHLITKRLTDNAILTNIITNGWLIDENVLNNAKKSGINNICVSIDGLQKTHDFMRTEDSFKMDLDAFDLMYKMGISSAASTTVTKMNLPELEELRDVLIEHNVTAWQLQLGLLMGNMKKNKHLILEPNEVNDIINFAYNSLLKEKKIHIHLSDCIGYYNLKEVEVKNNNFQVDDYYWDGCSAGKSSFGILNNGDIIGCTSIRDKAFVEGNIRNNSIIKIWNDPNSFNWNRNMTKEKLSGLCKKCFYGDHCLGGCSSTRIAMEGNLYSENKFCSYNVAIKEAESLLKDKNINTIENIKFQVKEFLKNENFQLAESILSDALNSYPDNLEILQLYGYTLYKLGNYNDCKDVNEKALKINSKDSYSNKGMGVVLHKLGQSELAIEFLEKATEYSNESFMDPYYDLAIVFSEIGKIKSALDVLEKGRTKSQEFTLLSQELYDRLLNNM